MFPNPHYPPSMNRIYPLRSDWQFRRENAASWQPIEMPGTFEAAGAPKDAPGPFWLRTTLDIPGFLPGQRLWLRFDGVSYACEIYIGERKVGNHIGTWDAFRVELTDTVTPGVQAELKIKVEKAASPTAGYQSPTVPGNYPLRETLAGFPPYIWGHAFGGLWQDAFVEITGEAAITDFWVTAKMNGAVRVSLALTAESPATLEIFDPSGGLIYQETRQISDAQPDFNLKIADPSLWSPWEPYLYTARLRLPGGAVHELRFGLRSVAAQGSRILINSSPVFVRMVLSWGWYPEHIAPNPGPDRVRADLIRLKSMGYNGVKLCLWFPPQYYFDLADELGMLLWVELPVWLPTMSEYFKRQTPIEFAALMRQARNHPSVILYTVGCELNEEAEAPTVRRLFEIVKSFAQDALVRDNSGSSEAYGGSLDESAEFYDHHFYADQQFMRPLLDMFAPGWREPQPWLFGEFCDYDTLRDIPQIQARNTEPRWWETENPQGVRAAIDLVDQPGSLLASGLWDRAGELNQVSVRQGLLHRKLTIELIRSRSDTSGYVVTGEVDTPISTAGMWDELDATKFPSEEFRRFNQDTVVFLGWRRQRRWMARGDRPVFRDNFCFRSGEEIRAHLVVSHFGRERGPAVFSWQAIDLQGTMIYSAKGQSDRISPGEVREIGVAKFTAPMVEHPRRIDLRADVRIGSAVVTNNWRLFIFPPDPWQGIEPVFLHDPAGRLEGLPATLHEPGGRPEELLAFVQAPSVLSGVGLFTVWEPALADWIAEGGAAILLLERDGMPSPVPKIELPYWRESLKFGVPHPAWGDFPEPHEPDMQFYGMAPDVALNPGEHSGEFGPIFQRVDTRQFTISDYVLELSIGLGRLLVSTLRLDGGLGDQPSGLENHPAGAHLLACWLRYLQSLRL